MEINEDKENIVENGGLEENNQNGESNISLLSDSLGEIVEISNPDPLIPSANPDIMPLSVSDGIVDLNFSAIQYALQNKWWERVCTLNQASTSTRIYNRIATYTSTKGYTGSLSVFECINVAVANSGNDFIGLGKLIVKIGQGAPGNIPVILLEYIPVGSCKYYSNPKNFVAVYNYDATSLKVEIFQSRNYAYNFARYGYDPSYYLSNATRTQYDSATAALTALPSGTQVYAMYGNTLPIVIGAAGKVSVSAINTNTSSANLYELFDSCWDRIIESANMVEQYGRQGISLYFWSNAGVMSVEQVVAKNAVTYTSATFVYSNLVSNDSPEHIMQRRFITITRNESNKNYTCTAADTMAVDSVLIGNPKTLSNSSTSTDIINTLFLGRVGAFEQIHNSWYKAFDESASNRSFGGIPVYSIAEGKVRPVLGIKCTRTLNGSNITVKTVTLDVQNTDSAVRTVTVSQDMATKALSVTYIISKTVTAFYDITMPSVPTIATLNTHMRTLMETPDANLNSLGGQSGSILFPNISSVVSYLRGNNPNILIFTTDVDNVYQGNCIVNHVVFQNQLEVSFIVMNCLINVTLNESNKIAYITRKYWNSL